MLLIEQNQKEIFEALESWDWLDFEGKKSFITTAFGDVLFESAEGIYFLDSIGGTLEKITNTKHELESILNTIDGQDHFLMAGLVVSARDEGLILKNGECCDFNVSPSLNGPLDLNNVPIMSFKVSLHVSGQIHKQIKDLPVGTKISAVKLDGA